MFDFKKFKGNVKKKIREENYKKRIQKHIKN